MEKNEWTVENILEMSAEEVWEISKDKSNQEKLEEAKAIWEDYLKHQMSYKKPTFAEYLNLVKKSMVLLGKKGPSAADRQVEYVYRYDILPKFVNNEDPATCAEYLLQLSHKVA